MSVTVTVYTTGPSCMACAQTKRHMKRRGIEFTEQGLDDIAGLNLLAVRELGMSQAPIVCASINGEEQFWDGYRPDRIDALGKAA